MKRLLVCLACLAGLAGALAAVRAQVSTDEATRRIAAILLPGQAVSVGMGRAEVHLFPRLAVEFLDLRVARTQAALSTDPDLTVDSLSVDIDVLPLLIGRTSISRLVMQHPTLHIQTGDDLASLVPDRALLSSLQPASIVVHGGEILTRRHDGTGGDRISDIQAHLTWPRLLGNLSLEGSATWRGEKVALTLQGIAPPRLLAGETGDVDIALDIASARMRFAGKSRLSDRLQLDGVVSLESEDPERDLVVLQSRDAAGSALAPPASSRIDVVPPIALRGRLKSLGWTGTLSDARLEIGSAAADGVLSASLDLARPQLRGTLAFGDIDLTPVISALDADRWRTWSPDLTIASRVDVDLRLSVGEARIMSTRLSNLAASVLVSDGRIHADVGDADWLDGALSLMVRGSLDREGLKVGGHAMLTKVALEALRQLADLQGLPQVLGRLSASGDFETSGRTISDLTARLQGDLTCEANHLVLNGLAAPAVSFAAAPAAMLRAARQKLDANPVIDRATCDMGFKATDIAIRKMELDLGGLHVDLAGKTSLATRLLSMSGEARLNPGTGKPAILDPGAMPVQVSGNLDRPGVALQSVSAGQVPAPSGPTTSVPTTGRIPGQWPTPD